MVQAQRSAPLNKYNQQTGADPWGETGASALPPQKGKKVRISSSYSAIKVRYLVHW